MTSVDISTSSVLRTVTRKVLPVGVRKVVVSVREQLKKQSIALRLLRLRRRVALRVSGAGQVQKVWHHRVRINDWETFYALYKDVFVHRIYHFNAMRPDPLILDCGSNIGGVILYLKHIYPQA